MLHVLLPPSPATIDHPTSTPPPAAAVVPVAPSAPSSTPLSEDVQAPMPTPSFTFLEAVVQLEFKLVCLIVYVTWSAVIQCATQCAS
jgi:hypothetical protein